ncbi:hypothetical protein T484DRAFT_1989618 [Baffinella frigidus]|nr:hypothetical protein T484DRAFT_1989618 [Cryptophyta sp. CCMP2293]
MPTARKHAMRAGMAFMLPTLTAVGLLSSLVFLSSGKFREGSSSQHGAHSSFPSHPLHPLLDLRLSGMHFRSAEPASPTVDAVSPSVETVKWEHFVETGIAAGEAAALLPWHFGGSDDAVAPSSTDHLENPPTSLEPAAPSQPSENAPHPVGSATPPEKRLLSRISRRAGQ